MWDYSATQHYSDLSPIPFKEEWEHEEAEANGESIYRDMKYINLLMLPNDDRDELEIDQEIEPRDTELIYIVCVILYILIQAKLSIFTRI